MLEFLLFNGVIIIISCLYVISKGRKLSKNIFTIILFTLLFWFFLGKGLIQYLTGANIDYAVLEVPADEIKVSDDYAMIYKSNTYLDGFLLGDVDVKFTEKYDEPTYILNLEYINSWVTRSLVGKEKINPEVVLYLPVKEVHK